MTASQVLAPYVERLRESGRLDERNRHAPEFEAKLPRSCLPLNTERKPNRPPA